MKLLLCLLLLPLAALAAGPALKFGVVPTESSLNLRKDYEPLRVDLEQALGRPVEMFFAPDYTGVIEAMRFGQVHVALLGNNSAIDAVDRAQGEVFAQTVDKDGQAGYWSLIVVHRDSPLTSLEELLAARGKLTFAMGDHQSTSGTLVPGYYAFALNGVDPAKEFKALRHANHEANLFAVANRQIDAATASNEAMFRLEQSAPAVAARVKAIWRGPLIASDPLVWRRDLPEATKTALRDFFARYGETPENRAKITALKWSGFRLSADDQLRPYRLLRVLRDQTKLETDPTLAPDEKARRLAELAARRAELERTLETAAK